MWVDLQEDILEELGSFTVDQHSIYREGLRWINKSEDRESKNNYGRWYWKQVYYPKNREAELTEQRERRATPEGREADRAASRKWYRNNKEKKKASEGRRKERLRQTPEGLAQLLAWNRAAQGRYIEKVKQDPVKLERLREASRRRSKAYRERRKNGQ